MVHIQYMLFIFADMRRIQFATLPYSWINSKQWTHKFINQPKWCDVTIQVISFNALSVYSCFLNHFFHFHCAFSVNDLELNVLSLFFCLTEILSHAHTCKNLNTLKFDTRDAPKATALIYLFYYLRFFLGFTYGSHLIRFKRRKKSETQVRLYDNENGAQTNVFNVHMQFP